jgi:cytosine/adenosine deaminase-related metal-dependent hydrolase
MPVSASAPQNWINGTLLLPNGEVRRGHLAVRRGRIDGVLRHAPPEDGGSVAVDLSGYLVLPGLVNAHDHLDFNCFHPCAPNRPYADAADWIADVRSGASDRMLETVTDLPLKQRLLAGAFKNLLSGAVTVAHHNPPHRFVHGGEFPVAVPRGIGYCHSLDTEPEPAHTLPRNPDTPWAIHAAEGTGRRAARELARLDQAGCLRPGTVLVHCLGIDLDDDPARITETGAGVVWCPTSNRFLYRATAPVELLRRHAPVALGTDSMISRGGGMIDELRAARKAVPGLTPAEIIDMSTITGAALFGLAGAKGAIVRNADADLVLFPLSGRAGDDPLEAAFAATGPSLVVRGGVPQVGARAFLSLMQRLGLDPRPIGLDGRELWLPRGLHRLFTRMLEATRGWPPFEGRADLG